MKMIELYTTGPANILRLSHGRLQAGSRADITIFSDSMPWTYDVNKSKSKSRNSPFHGVEFKGCQRMTIVAGRVVWSAI